MKTRKRDTRWLVGVAMFVALQLTLQLTGIGLIPLPLINATTLHIPVIVGAVLLGPLAGAVLGGTFGLCSMWTATINPTPLSFAFSPVLAAEAGGAAGAVKAVWIALGCRILIGVVSGWLWTALKRLKISDYAALPVVGVAGALTNTGLVMGSIFFLLRPEFAEAKNVGMEMVLGLVMTVVATSGVDEAAVLATAACKALLHVPALKPHVQAG